MTRPSPTMAVEANAAPSRATASSVGAILPWAPVAVANSECSSPRSLLSRIIHRRGRGGGSRCRLRLCLPLPRHCYGGAAGEDAASSAAVKGEAASSAAAMDDAAVPKVVVGSRAEPPRSSLAGKKAALPASLGLGVSLVLLFSKVGAELNRMAELRAQMERLMNDVRTSDLRSRNGRPSASDGHAKEPIACSGSDEEVSVLSQSRGSRTGASANSGGDSENAGHRESMDQMEAELEAELLRLELSWNDEENKTSRRYHPVEVEARSVASSGSHSVICSDEEEGDQDDERSSEGGPAHGGVPARELERRLHELLQSRHEARIAQLESELERAQRKLVEKEREACRWRYAAKLAARVADQLEQPH